MRDPILELRNLVTVYNTGRGPLRAVDGVSLTITRGEALGLVGESGCGKSALGQSIMRLIQPPGQIVAGEVIFDGHDLLRLPAGQMRRILGREIAMIFQDATSALNPVLRIGDQVAEVLRLHTDLSASAIRARTIAALEAVGIPEPAERYASYPYEFSGGMQQRVVIATALALGPRLIIADEPTTALDVTVQAQILTLLQELKAGRSETAIILISHDLGVVSQLCDRICVMYAGNAVEIARTENILQSPLHPYTLGLMRSMPQLSGESGELEPIPGALPDPVNPPAGCKFADRCPQVMAVCSTVRPPLRAVAEGHAVACHLHV